MNFPDLAQNGRGRGVGGRGAGRGAVLDTGILEILTNDDTNDVSNPLTAPIRAIQMKEVALDVWMRGLTTNMSSRIGVQLSNDPIDFTSGSEAVLVTGYQSSNGWVYGTTWHDLTSLGLTDANYGLYLRFVALAKRSTAGSGIESGQIRLRVRQKPVRARTLTSSMVRVNSEGSGSTTVFVPMTNPIPTEGVAVHRVMTEVSANMGVSVQPAWQETDTPDDASSWSAATTIESAVVSNAVSYPGNVASVSFTKRFCRYGADCKNNTATTPVKAALVRLTIDQRDQ